MKLFRWIVKYIKSIFGNKEKPPDTSATNEPVVSQPPKARKKTPKKVDYVSMQVDDLPEEDKIESNIVYVVGENGYYWLTAFKCPCGCNDLVQLNLLSNGDYIWRIRCHSSGLISIHPSINRIVGCRSHFFIREGCVEWDTSINHGAVSSTL